MERVEVRAGERKQLLRAAAQRSVVVLVVVVPLLLAFWRVSEQHPLGEMTLWVYVAVAGLLVLGERWLAFDGRWGSAIRGNVTDFVYVILATAMDKVSFVFCVTAIAAIGSQLATSFQIDLWPRSWSLGFQVLLALVIADAAAYARHRLFHKSSLLWRFHRIHHSMTELYWIRSAYTHPLEQLSIFAAIMLPIALLGAGAEIVAAIAFLFGVSGLLQHANVDSRSSFLNYVFATPEVHRVHHRADERGNHSNFSAFFVLMDILFGTYDRPARDVRFRVGLEGVRAFPRDFLSHLAMPFRRDPVGLDGGGGWHGPGEVARAGRIGGRERP